jgi:hypothetical protein
LPPLPGSFVRFANEPMPNESKMQKYCRSEG